MPATVAIVSATFPVNVLTAQELTVPGFGTVKAALVYCSYGSLEQDAAYQRSSWGFVDQNDGQACIGSTSEQGAADSNGSLSVTDTHCAQSWFSASSTHNMRLLGAMIPDGIRLTPSDWNDGNNYSATVILIGGDVESKVVTKKLQQAPHSITGIGFTPNAAIINGMGASNLAGRTAGTGMAIGALTDIGGVKFRHMHAYSPEFQASMRGYGGIHNSWFAAAGTTSISSRMSHTAFSASNGGEHTYTVAGSTTGNHVQNMLYLRFADEDFAIEDFVLPATGDTDLTTANFTPAMSILCGATGITSYLTSQAVQTTNVYGSYQMFSTADYEGSFSTWYTDAVATQNTGAMHSITLAKAKNHLGTLAVQFTTAGIDNGFTYSFTVADAIKNQQFAIMIGTRPVPAPASSIYLGDINVTNMHFGPTLLESVYKGTDLLWTAVSEPVYEVQYERATHADANDWTAYSGTAPGVYQGDVYWSAQGSSSRIGAELTTLDAPTNLPGALHYAEVEFIVPFSGVYSIGLSVSTNSNPSVPDGDLHYSTHNSNAGLVTIQFTPTTANFYLAVRTVDIVASNSSFGIRRIKIWHEG